MSPLWITKHQYRLPSVLVTFYSLVSNTDTASLEDNKIKNEVNSIRSLVASTNYKTKFVLVLVADGPIETADLEERLVNIRRGTNFDSKALYFLPSASSVTELREFAKVLFSTLHPTCIEYYRDLSKHARRKRNRNNVPPPTIPPASTPLSLHGWNVRYEFKLGIFAETRQEFDAATRNYEQAYEGLFHTELMELIPAWSTRFNEARMLADVLAIRIIRCLFWSTQTALAVRWWVKHRDRIRGLVERRGKGSENYGWEAWLTIWSNVMAELIGRADLFPTARARLPPGSDLPVQILLERSAPNVDRRPPWESLHHEGYWLNSVRKHTGKRRQLAEQIPPEHKTVSQNKDAASKQTYMYDTYLTPDPAIESKLLEGGPSSYTKRICDNIDQAVLSFAARDQHRMIDMLRYLQAVELSAVGEWSTALQMLRPLWQHSHWRQQGWLQLLCKLSDLLLQSAVHAQDDELCLLLNWELSVLKREHQSPSQSDSAPVSTALDLNNATPSLVSTFAFAAESGHVGEPIPVQFAVNALSPTSLSDMQIIEVKIVFDGGINPILLKANNSGKSEEHDQSNSLSKIEVFEENTNNSSNSKRISISGGSYWLGQADFTLSRNGHSVYAFDIIPREAGPVAVASVTILVGNASREITINTTNIVSEQSRWWESRNGRVVSREFGMHRNVSSIIVLPKPPKVSIDVVNLASTYYTNEKIVLEIELTNGEEETVRGDLHAQFIGASPGLTLLRWQHDLQTATGTDNDAEEVALLVSSIEGLQSTAVQSHKMILSGFADSMDHELELKFGYTLQSDSTTILTKQVVFDLPVIRPFEANATFYPRLHPEQWPDFFAAPEVSDTAQPKGLKQAFDVRADIASFAPDILHLNRLELIPRRLVGGATSKSGLGTYKQSVIDAQGSLQIRNEETKQFHFELELQKLILGNRAPVTADYAIEVHWSRAVTPKEINTSTLLLPKLLAPMSEPRVLLQVIKQENLDSIYSLHYTIENPSMHFLTFNISLESGDGFAFSGPKTKSISLVPISRYTVDYRILMQKNKEWVNVQLNVLDAFFGQTLKVLPASEGIRLDKQGQVQVWSEELSTIAS